MDSDGVGLAGGGEYALGVIGYVIWKCLGCQLTCTTLTGLKRHMGHHTNTARSCARFRYCKQQLVSDQRRPAGRVLTEYSANVRLPLDADDGGQVLDPDPRPPTPDSDDPAMFDQPVLLYTWLHAQENPACEGSEIPQVTSYNLQPTSSYAPNDTSSFVTDPYFADTYEEAKAIWNSWPGKESRQSARSNNPQP